MGVGDAGADAGDLEEGGEGGGAGEDDGVENGVGEDHEGGFAGLGGFGLAPVAEGGFEGALRGGVGGGGLFALGLEGGFGGPGAGGLAVGLAFAGGRGVGGFFEEEVRWE